MLDINLDDYESIFDAVSALMLKETMEKHTMADVIDFPLGENRFGVSTLKKETEELGKDAVKYVEVSKESKDKQRVLRIDRYAEVYARYTNVCLDNNGNEIKDTRKKMYEFCITDEPDYYKMFIEVLYEIKHYA